MEFLAERGLEIFGAFGMVIAVLLFWIRQLIVDLREEKKYAREVNKLFQDNAVKTIHSLRNLQESQTVIIEVLNLVKDRLRNHGDGP